MGIVINIYENKIIIYDSRNSIAYHRFMAAKFKDYYAFRRQIKQYANDNNHPCFADILDLAARNKITAVNYNYRRELV